MASKLDLLKEYKQYYTSKPKPEVVEFGEVSYLALEGQGEPAGEAFVDAIGALYPLAFGVPKLEGLWWVDSVKPALEVPREEWYWKLLIRMPEFVDAEMVEEARVVAFNKKGLELIHQINFEILTEGKCVQIMHVGPYATEPATIEQMQDYMKDNNYTENGLHHEIYISDPRKAAPEKMKTILRQPIK
jgi:hypothetical protein